MGGSTDSAAFTQGGFRSIGITGLSHKLEDYYHTRRDSYDILDEIGLENCYLATIRFIEKFEEQYPETLSEQASFSAKNSHPSKGRLFSKQ